MGRFIPRQYAKILYGLTKDLSEKQYSPAVDQFVLMLRRDQMLSKVSYIAKAFEQYVREREGIPTVEVTTARKISEKIIAVVEKKYGLIAGDVKLEPAHIGGIEIQVNNSIIDGTVKTQLQRMQRYLSQE